MSLGGKGGEPDMAGMEAMLKGMGGGKGGGEGGEPDMAALMEMLGKGGMGGMGGGKGGMGGGKGQEDPNAEREEEGGWKWSQKGDEIQVTVPLPEATTKKDIAVVFKAASLKVTVKGEVKLEGALSDKVETDECTWCLSSDKTELNVMLTKIKDGNWAKLFG